MAATTIMFTSCSKDKAIVGEWRCITASTSDSDFDLSLTKGETWKFNDDGRCSVSLSFRASNKADISNGDWTINGDELVIKLDPDTYTDVGLTAKDEWTGTFNIETLNKKNLVISGKWVSIVTINNTVYPEENGTETYTINASYEFEPK